LIIGGRWFELVGNDTVVVEKETFSIQSCNSMTALPINTKAGYSGFELFSPSILLGGVYFNLVEDGWGWRWQRQCPQLSAH
jgi:hypothetical protein